MSSPPNDRFSTDPRSSGVMLVEDLDLEALAAVQSRHAPVSLDLYIARGIVADDIARSQRLRQLGADTVYVAFSLAAWVVINVLGALGCAVAFFIVISAGEWDAFFLQLDNLTSRYVAADLGRRGMFEHQILWAFAILLAIICALRLPGFIRSLRAGLAEARVR
jgi:hypothetical protein